MNTDTSTGDLPRSDRLSEGNRSTRRMITVAVSGPDNVGKSTQIRLLFRRAGLVDAGRLDAFDSRWSAAHARGLAEWWFGGAPVEQVVDVLACSYLARAAARDTATVRLADRGVPMLEAGVVATVAVREGIGYDAAVGRAEELLAPYRQRLQRAESTETGLLLLHAGGPEAGTAWALAREPQVSPRYAAYQRMLQTHLYALETSGRFARTIVVADRSILAVQSEIATWLNDLGVAVPPLALDDVDVVALGGLSESGKSTAGRYLALRHGYARLKIGYLLETAAACHDVPDVYALDERGIAELLADGLERYCAAHHFQRRVSIESVHRDGMTGELAKLLGKRLTVVYVEADKPTRTTRNAAGQADVVQRDEIKRSRGAEGVRHLADVVMDNTGSRLRLYRALDRLAADIAWPSVAPRRVLVDRLGLHEHLSRYLRVLLARTTGGTVPLVSLLAVTGSGARGKYQDGWSDLDVLAVAETERLDELRAVLTDSVDDLAGVKLGFTVLSAAECAAGAVTPRLLHTLTLIGSGRLPVL